MHYINADKNNFDNHALNFRSQARCVSMLSILWFKEVENHMRIRLETLQFGNHISMK